ncbi:MAG: cytochrome c biogenesis protein CcsA [Deltaproteobacteria bacterium]
MYNKKMSSIEFLLLIVGLFLYLVSFVAGWLERFAGKEVLFLSGGLILQFASAAVRWYGIGHPPVNGTYEAALAGSWFLLLYTTFSYRSIHGHFRALLFTTIPIAIFILLYGLNFNTERIPLTISERSLWVDFHALFSWLAFGSYAAAACLAGSYLLVIRGQRSGASGQGAEEIANSSLPTPHPSLDILDDLIFRYINLGFITHTVMFALGSYYSSILFGTWWQWDPVNSTSLITWLAYGLAIHMRLFYGWKGRRGANLAIVAFLTATISYWGLIYFPPGSTYHVFDLELKSH